MGTGVLFHETVGFGKHVEMGPEKISVNFVTQTEVWHEGLL